MFGIDTIAVTALAIWRPRFAEAEPRGEWARQAAKVAVGVCILIGLASAASMIAFTSPIDALAWLRGEAITIDTGMYDIGKGNRGEERRFRLPLTNRTTRPIRIVGGTTDCECVATGDLPIELAAGATQSIEVVVRFVGSPGRFQRVFKLMTDDPRQRRMSARFTGEVLAPVE